ncbi:MAG: hypothetical protein EXS67_02265 [Candidatus Margulisbacteria bacterium]|nr:hypothetical protein [Candidatus Margulisiibacteriota bacterium]
MKKLILGLVLLLGTSLTAHDGGHGPFLTDSPVHGGVVAPVIQASNVKLGRKASLIYKGELLRSEDGTVRVYIYNAKMQILPLSQFDKKGIAILESKSKKGWDKKEFTLTLGKDSFVGVLPKGSIRKPYNIDVFVTEKGKKLLVAFDNLD